MKYAVALFALLSGVSLAAEQPKLPMLKLAVYENDGKTTKELGSRYDVKNEKLSLCWVIFNMPFETKNLVTEIFVSPAAATFHNNEGSSVKSNDGKTHTIQSELSRQNDNFLARCWKFDLNDPMGKYSVQVQINNIQFDAQTFELVK